MIDGICRELDALCARIDARIETMLADCLAAIERVIEQRRQRDAADISLQPSARTSEWARDVARGHKAFTQQRAKAADPDDGQACADTPAQQPDLWEAGGQGRLTRDLEALVSAARACGVSDEEILPKSSMSPTHGVRG